VVNPVTEVKSCRMVHSLFILSPLPDDWIRVHHWWLSTRDFPETVHGPVRPPRHVFMLVIAVFFCKHKCKFDT